MKKLILLALGLGALSCTNAKLVDYNAGRLDTIEDYLKANKHKNEVILFKASRSMKLETIINDIK